MILTAALVAITAFYAWQNKRMAETMGRQAEVMKLQADAMKRQSDASVYLHVQERMHEFCDVFHEVRRYPPEFKGWTAERRRTADDASVELEGVSYLAMKGLVDSELVMSSHAAIFHDCWKALQGSSKIFGSKRDIRNGNTLRSSPTDAPNGS